MKTIVVWSLAAAMAGAQTCTDASCFGSATADPLVVSGTWTVADGAILDFGSRHVVFTATSHVVFENSATILAAKITQAAGGVMSYDALGAANALLSGGVVRITTTTAGGHDGGASLLGSFNFSGDWFWPGYFGLSLEVEADGPAVVSYVNASAGDPYPAGGVSIEGSSIDVGGVYASATAAYASPGSISLWTTGNATVGSLVSQGGDYAGSWPQVTVFAGGDYLQTGAVEATYPWSGVGGVLGEVQITALGAATIAGPIATGGGQYGGGRAAVSAGTDLFATASIRSDAPQFVAGSVELESGRDMQVLALLSATVPYDHFSSTGGVIRIRAGRDLLLASAIAVDSAQTDTTYGTPLVDVDVCRDATLTSSCAITALDYYGGSSATGGTIQVSGCRVFMNAGAQMHAAGSHASFSPTTALVGGESVVMNGVMTASSNGSTFVTTRLPTVYGYSGSGLASPAPTFVVDPSAPPCAAKWTTTLTASGAIQPGAVATVAIQSVPNAPLFIACDTVLSNAGLGPFGWTQVDGFGGAHRLVDALGILGPPIPGSTDSGGAWSLSALTPAAPSLVGVQIFFDVYVFDPGALNGLFHQPAVKHVVFI